MFDNGATVTVHPFFDSMGKPLSNVSVEVAPGQAIPSAQFATQFSVSEETGATRVVKVIKPGAEEAVTVELGYDQKVKLDLSAVADEKLTLVHIGEKLIILFDNKSTVTVHPFFNSMGVPLSNISVGVSPTSVLPSGDFASTFPISTDQSILPTAGPGNAGTEKSGANFVDPSVDPLNLPNPLDLLPPEQLPGIVFTPEEPPRLPGILPEPPIPPVNGVPSVGSNALAQLDDDALTGGNAGGIGDDPNAVNVTGILSHDYGSDGRRNDAAHSRRRDSPGGLYGLRERGGYGPHDPSGQHEPRRAADLVEQHHRRRLHGHAAEPRQPSGRWGRKQSSVLDQYVVTDGNGDTATGRFGRCRRRFADPRCQAVPITATVLEAGLSTSNGDAGDQSEGIRGPGETTDFRPGRGCSWFADQPGVSRRRRTGHVRPVERYVGSAELFSRTESCWSIKSPATC